jgi:hypothetical protein
LGKVDKNKMTEALEGTLKALDFQPPPQAQTVYYPNVIGFPTPPPPKHYEFAVYGKQDEKCEALPNIMKVLASANARVVSMSLQSDESFDQFVMLIVSDLRAAKCSADELLIRINKSKFVRIAELSPLDGKLFPKLCFPLTFFGGEIRALALDSDRFVNLFDRITRAAGEKAKRALYEDRRTEGSEIVEVLKGKLGERAKEGDYVLENAGAFLQAAGWGRVTFSKRDSSGIYKVIISDPPSDAEGDKATGNWFLQGMVGGILESFLSNETKLSLVNEGYDDEKRNLSFFYMSKAEIKALAREPQEEEPKAEVVKHVEKIIQSLQVIEGGTPEISKTKPAEKDRVMPQRAVVTQEGSSGIGMQIIRPPPSRKKVSPDQKKPLESSTVQRSDEQEGNSEEFVDSDLYL